MSDFKLSIIFGVASRGITFINQILFVPLIIALIGIDNFTDYNVMTAGVAWLTTLGGCLLPSIVGDIARAKIDNRVDIISEKISSSLFVMFLLCFFLSFIYILFFISVDLTHHVLVVFSLLILLFSTADNIRQGMSENYKNTIYNCLANIVSLSLILLMYYISHTASILTIIVITFGVVSVFKFINLFPYLKLFSIGSISLHSARDMFIKAKDFIIISISYYCNTAAIISMLGWMGYAYLTKFILLQKLALLAMGGVVMVRNPLWSIIARMAYKGEHATIYNKYIKALKIYIMLSPVTILSIFFLSKFFLLFWAKGVVFDSRTIICFSIYLVVVLVSYVNSILYYGLELFDKASKYLMIEAIVNLLFLYIIAKLNADIFYAFIVMAVASLIININVSRLIRRGCFNAY